mgnify:CR=1 FL=1
MRAAEQLEQLLAGHVVERCEHRPILSATEAAEVRGTPLEQGGKALVMKLGKQFAVVAVGGDARLVGRAVRRHLGVQRYRFASPDELLELTGLRPGCVPPFGRPVFELPLYVDAALARQPRIAFTLAVPHRSAILDMSTYLSLAAPRAVLPLTEEP